MTEHQDVYRFELKHTKEIAQSHLPPICPGPKSLGKFWFGILDQLPGSGAGQQTVQYCPNLILLPKRLRVRILTFEC